VRKSMDVATIFLVGVALVGGYAIGYAIRRYFSRDVKEQ
jgi:uncharacterized membrane-anchored protein YhcB (DUF1043 family)